MGKKFRLTLLVIFFWFALVHFYRLPEQEFVGDEASPILLLSRAGDAITLKDWRYLAWPWLWYHDPLRAVFNVGIINFTGVNRVWLRLSNIFFSLIIFWALYFIFRKEKIYSWLIILSLAAYASSAIVMDSRLAGGDSLVRLLVLSGGYFIYEGRFNRAAWLLLAASLTMLDAVILIPVLWFKNKQSLFKPGMIFLVYLGLWLLLPYLAYRFGYQPWFENRGLWYYFSRVGEGVSFDPFLPFRALAHYSSWPFAAWLFLGSVGSYLAVPAWLGLVLLSRSSIHILIFIELFFFLAVLVLRRLPRLVVILGLSLTIFFNLTQLVNHFFRHSFNPADEFPLGHIDAVKQPDQAVEELYRRFSTSE